MGDGDAHLTAQEVLADFPGILVFVFADAPTKSPETVEKMILIKQALGSHVPLVVPCFEQDNPYSPIVLSTRGVDFGRVIWNWQKADEEDYPEAAQARLKPGLRNVGMFAAEASVFGALQRFKNEQFTTTGRFKRWQQQMAEWRAAGGDSKRRPKDPEFGFADLMKVLPADGFEVAAACLARPGDRLNVNKVEDIDDVNQLLKETCPCLQPMVETNQERREIIVRFYDANSNGEIVSQNGMPSVRNYTRFLVGADQVLDGPDVRRIVEEHIQTLKKRIVADVGLAVLPTKIGVA
jgi:hypothetical protein